MFRTARFSIVLTLAAGQNASLFCKEWCHDGTSAECPHEGSTTSPRVSSEDNCRSADVGAVAFVREDARRTASIFFSLLLFTVSFLPIFTSTGQAGRLFMPLGYAKTFAMFAASILSITLVPPLIVLLLRGRFRTEATNPVVAHGVGMWNKHRMEAQVHAKSGPWVVALYWVCWLLLAAVVALLFVRR